MGTTIRPLQTANSAIKPLLKIPLYFFGNLKEPWLLRHLLQFIAADLPISRGWKSRLKAEYALAECSSFEIDGIALGQGDVE
jgi:hypothetical protein